MATRQEILTRVREKYPEYQEVPDDQLATGLASKYPEYAEDLAIREPTISPRDQFISQYIASEQRPALTQLSSAAAVPFQMGAEAIRTLGGGAEALGEVMGRSTLPSTAEQPLSQRIAEALSKRAANVAVPILPSAITDTIGRAFPQVVQAGVEGGARSLFDLGNAINQAVRFAADEPLSLPTNLTPGGLVQSFIQSLSPRTPTREEAERAFGRQEVAQQAASVLAEPLVPEILGETSIPLAEGMRTVAELAPGSPAALRTSARVAEALARGTGRAITSPIAETRALARSVMRGTGTAPVFEGLNLSKTTREKSLNVFNPSADEIATQSYDRNLVSLPEIKEWAPKGGILNHPDFNKASEAAKRSKIQIAKGALKEAEEQGLMSNGRNAYTRATEALQGKALTDLEKTQILKDFEKWNRDIDPTEAQTILASENADLGPLYRASRDRQADLFTQARYAVKRAFRDELSDDVDLLVKSIRGIDESPYRQYGMINDLQHKAALEFGRSEKASARRPAIGIPLPTSVQGAAKAGEVAGGSSKGRYNNFIRGLMEETPKKKAPRKISPEEQKNIRSLFEMPPVIPEAPITVPPVRVPASRAAASEFSPETQEALRAMGATPRDPYYQALGRSIQRRGQVIPPQ